MKTKCEIEVDGEIEVFDVEVDEAAIIRKCLFGGDARPQVDHAHWIATQALFAISRHGFGGPQTLESLSRLHDQMCSSSTPQQVVDEFCRRGKLATA